MIRLQDTSGGAALCSPRIALLLALAALAGVTGCKPPHGAASDSATPGRLAAPLEQPAARVVAGQITAGGIAATYQASFIDGTLARIAETRPSGNGHYQFHGARLVAYTGTALDVDQAIELRFDLQGRVSHATAGGHDLAAAQLSALLTRAQILRSHALAQHASRSHPVNPPAAGLGKS